MKGVEPNPNSMKFSELSCGSHTHIEVYVTTNYITNLVCKKMPFLHSNIKRDKRTNVLRISNGIMMQQKNKIYNTHVHSKLTYPMK